MSKKTCKEDNGQFPNCQSWSFITEHGYFYQMNEGYDCQVTS